jgi:multiple sugar transport system ATP-binding protein
VGTPTQVYGRPATLYVAAFLGSPRMNLLEAEVYVHLDRHIALHMGDQVLHLPWNDLRSRQVAHFHGERIVIGVRAEALTPVPDSTTGDVLRGRIRYLEHHGHESLAFLDIGATAVIVDEIGKPPTDVPINGGGLRRFVSKITGRGGEDELVGAGVNGRNATQQRRQQNRESVLSDPGRHHRRPAELAVRLAPYPNVTHGHPLTVAVRMEALHFFDERGQRIDVGWR